MRHDDPYEAWKHARAGAEVPGGFADKVMAVVRARQARRPVLLRVLLTSPVVRIGIGSLACAVCLLRILQVVAVFLAGQPSM
jgi:hypothetical protein